MTFYADTLIQTLQPPQKRSTNVEIFLGNNGMICDNSFLLPPI